MQRATLTILVRQWRSAWLERGEPVQITYEQQEHLLDLVEAAVRAQPYEVAQDALGVVLELLEDVQAVGGQAAAEREWFDVAKTAERGRAVLHEAGWLRENAGP
jgi:hypothetical protein